MTKSKIQKIFEILEKNIESLKTELEYINEFTFCVAVILSAQSTDKSVNKATNDLFKIVTTPEEMRKLEEDELKQFIKSIGLYNNKAKNIMKFSEVLIEKFHSTIPKDRDVLEKLPGIGKKSANVIANNLFDMPYIAVDTHVLRVSKRLRLSKSETPLQVERDLLNVIPKRFHKHASNLLVLHGRYTCTAKFPKCSTCCIKNLCPYFFSNNMIKS
ncbi:MAG: endonuclease III [Holosporales bacterium]|jgi:endonuclease-3|nr:endonuclease III [Holosporales bacterium]